MLRLEAFENIISIKSRVVFLKPLITVGTDRRSVIENITENDCNKTSLRQM